MVSLDADLSLIKEKSKKEIEDEIAKKEGAVEYNPGDSKVIQPIGDAAKSSVDSLFLPTGYLDEEGNLHTELFIKEMTGEEEDILTSKKMTVYARMNRIMENCVLSIGKYDQKSSRWKDVIRSLIASDRLFIVLQLRILSLGQVFSQKCQCGECEMFSNQNVNLNDFVIPTLKEPTKRTWTVTLPQSKKMILLKVQDGYAEAALQKHAESLDLLSIAMLGRVVEIDGQQPVKVGMLKKLSFKDRQFIRNEFRAKEGEFETVLEYECGNCGAENKDEIHIGHPSFFFPSET